MFDTPPPERKKKDEESETRVRMNCHSGKVKRVVIRRAWKTQRHTHTHTPRTGAHPSSRLFSKARESKARPRTKRSWIPSTAHFGGPGLRNVYPLVFYHSRCVAGAAVEAPACDVHCSSRADAPVPWPPKTSGDGCFTTSAAGTPRLREMGRGGRGPLSAGRGSLLQFTQGNVH